MLPAPLRAVKKHFSARQEAAIPSTGPNPSSSAPNSLHQQRRTAHPAKEPRNSGDLGDPSSGHSSSAALELFTRDQANRVSAHQILPPSETGVPTLQGINTPDRSQSLASSAAELSITPSTRTAATTQSYSSGATTTTTTTTSSTASAPAGGTGGATSVTTRTSYPRRASELIPKSHLSRMHKPSMLSQQSSLLMALPSESFVTGSSPSAAVDQQSSTFPIMMTAPSTDDRTGPGLDRLQELPELQVRLGSTLSGTMPDVSSHSAPTSPLHPRGPGLSNPFSLQQANTRRSFGSSVQFASDTWAATAGTPATAGPAPDVTRRHSEAPRSEDAVSAAVAADASPPSPPPSWHPTRSSGAALESGCPFKPGIHASKAGISSSSTTALPDGLAGLNKVAAGSRGSFSSAASHRRQSAQTRIQEVLTSVSMSFDDITGTGKQVTKRAAILAPSEPMTAASFMPRSALTKLTSAGQVKGTGDSPSDSSAGLPPPIRRRGETMNGAGPSSGALLDFHLGWTCRIVTWAICVLATIAVAAAVSIRASQIGQGGNVIVYP
ncbi:hypothetical protein BC828DRAFT_407039 [Blastocladiella britannica]|nr:hypothetical protein BC828DRAFT_407039 [Blastocladiella britannica]